MADALFWTEATYGTLTLMLHVENDQVVKMWLCRVAPQMETEGMVLWLKRYFIHISLRNDMSLAGQPPSIRSI